jgi:hypothetical protein
MENRNTGRYFPVAGLSITWTPFFALEVNKMVQEVFFFLFFTGAIDHTPPFCGVYRFPQASTVYWIFMH